MLTQSIYDLLPDIDYSYYGTKQHVAETIALGYRKAGHMSPNKYSKLSKLLFPNKPRGKYLSNYLLSSYGLKHCHKCDTTLEFIYFRKNSTNSDGLHSHCRVCQGIDTAKTQAARQAKYRSAKLQAVPKWANLDAIALFYYNTPNGMSVDHIVPLQGETVCGLHTLDNLQYLTPEANSAKRNRF